MSRVVFVNGDRGAACPTEDRGLQFGDGVFETMLCVDGAPIAFDRHFARLSRGCAALGIELPVLRESVLKLVREHAPRPRGVAKLVLTRGSSERGYRFPSDIAARWILSVGPAPVLAASVFEEGVRVTRCRTRVSFDDPSLNGLKHLNRLAQVQARREWDDEFHEGLLCNYLGELAEGTASNVFLVRHGALVTPDLAHGGVRGIMRERVIEHARHAGLTLSERRVPLAELDDTDEVFLTNSTCGVVPVRAIGDRTYACGPVTRQIIQELCRGGHC